VQGRLAVITGVQAAYPPARADKAGFAGEDVASIVAEFKPEGPPSPWRPLYKNRAANSTGRTEEAANHSWANSSNSPFFTPSMKAAHSRRV